LTVILQDFPYLEGDYLEDAYLSNSLGAMGFQATIVIEDDKPNGMQAEVTPSTLNNNGIQATMVAAVQTEYGNEVRVDKALFHRPKGYLTGNYLSDAYLVADDGVCLLFGLQANIQIVDYQNPVGTEALFGVADFLNNNGFQAQIQILDFTGPQGVQSEITITDFLNNNGIQSEITIADYLNNNGIQSEINILDFPDSNGMQGQIQILDFLDNNGIQSEITIADYLNNNGFQTRITIEPNIVNPPGTGGGFKPATGFQVNVQALHLNAMQGRVVIYNTTNLRILCSFPSRGVVDSNWVSNSTAAGDFDVNNVNTDIVEQVWRSDTPDIPGVSLECDTGLPQGVAVDTVAVLGTNITTSATVVLQGSNVSNFATIDREITLFPVSNGNMYHVSESLPSTQQRYWRLNIDDPTQPDGYLEVGIILFGSAEIFFGECFRDQISFQQRDFAKTVRTEGQTNVMNSRSQKRKLGLEFQSLEITNNNYNTLRDIFEDSRTILKCLWIPTPDPDDATIIDRYAVFAKLTEIPVERHNNKGKDKSGRDLTFVSLTVDLDESL
jgi:hypothetical protein